MISVKGKSNIGEEMDKIVAKLTEANELRGVIDVALFNDSDINLEKEKRWSTN